MSWENGYYSIYRNNWHSHLIHGCFRFFFFFFLIEIKGHHLRRFQLWTSLWHLSRRGKKRGQLTQKNRTPERNDQKGAAQHPAKKQAHRTGAGGGNGRRENRQWCSSSLDKVQGKGACRRSGRIIANSQGGKRAEGGRGPKNYFSLAPENQTRLRCVA